MQSKMSKLKLESLKISQLSEQQRLEKIRQKMLDSTRAQQLLDKITVPHRIKLL
jgi:hypothetical protein